MAQESLFALAFTLLNLSMFIDHPIMIGLIILIISILYSVILVNVISTSWFSYIIFIVFLGGLLILFIYVISLIANQDFFSTQSINTGLALLMFLSLWMLNNEFFSEYSETKDSIMFNKTVTAQSENSKFLMLISSSSFRLSIGMMLYLFLALIVVVYVVDISMGSLRPL